MKKITSLIIILALFINAQEKSKIIKKNGHSLTKIIQTYRFDKLPDDGSYKININDISGDINIYGHEGSGAKIIITNIAMNIPKDDFKKAHKLSRPIVTHIEDQSTINIFNNQTKPKNDDIENVIEIKIPKNININFQLLGGDLYLDDIKGEALIETLGGDIKIKNYKGRIEAKTNGGDLYISNQDGVLRAHSFGGNITISNSKGELSSSSIGGDIFMENLIGKINSQTSGGSINLTKIEGENINCHSSGGSIKGEEISGQIKIKNSGEGINIFNASGNIELHSAGGFISVRDIRGSIKCETSIGEIKMLNISGKIEGLSSNGNIFLELLYDSSIDDFSVHLETHSGDIGIDIPKNLPLNIKSILYQSTLETDLHSEIPLNISSSHNKVIGTKIIKGGTIPINLEAHAGSIMIKEF